MRDPVNQLASFIRLNRSAVIRRIMTVSLSGANFAIQTANMDHKKEIFLVI